MTIYQKVQAVNKVYKILEKDLNKFSRKSGISCPANCCKCCVKNDIEATVLEFLPLAYNLFREGKAFSQYQILKQNTNINFCNFLVQNSENSLKGYCNSYKYRALVCRLFGFSAFTDKNEKHIFSTCNILKEAYPKRYSEIIEEPDKYNLPFNSNYYYRLNLIDIELGTKFYRVNEAVVRALEIVLGYYSYRRKPKNAG